MLQLVQGNLLSAPVDALVNTVNEVGVMGKGIAAMFREAFPHNTEEYERAAKMREIRVGKMFVTENPTIDGPRWIINFPTKKHWRKPSRIDWIRDGLKDLVRVIRERGIKSVALPPLGCGNGGLNWPDVKAEILRALGPLEDVDVVVYEPTSEYQAKPKQRGVEKLTVARALIAELVRRYAVLGLECTILEVQKLAWFLAREIRRDRLRDPLRLRFAADKYGPYDDRLRHLLNALDGSYLHSAKRLADSTPYDLIWFDSTRSAKLAAFLRSSEAREYLPALERTVGIIEGFESPFGMELLATVDWLLYRESVTPQLGALREGIARWPAGEAAAKRKLELFDDRVLTVALKRIIESQSMARLGTLFD
jgi:O-acetyl-ADP-ribose deacetylase (regulator of RNase III)